MIYIFLASFFYVSNVQSPDTNRLHQQLSGIEIRAKRRTEVMQVPKGERHGPIFDGHLLTPGHKVAVWYSPPDSTSTYLVKAVRIRFGKRPTDKKSSVPKSTLSFIEGRVQIWFNSGSEKNGPSIEENLLKDKIILSSAMAGKSNKWVRIDMNDQNFIIPSKGFYVVAEGMPSLDNDIFVPNENSKNLSDKLTIISVSGERSVSPWLFPFIGFRIVNDSKKIRTWQLVEFPGKRQWMKINDVQNAIKTKVSRSSTYYYNADLELEVEVFEKQ